MKSTIGALNRGLMARVLLTSIGGLAQLVAGLNGHYHADKQTPKRPRSRRGNYGENLRAHFDSKARCWSAKKNKQRKAYGRTFA